MEGVAAERTLRFLVKIDADLDEAERALVKLQLMLSSIDQTKATATIDLDGIEEAIEQIRLLQEQLDSLPDDKTVTIHVNVDFDPDALNQKLNEFMQDQDQTIHINVDIDQDSIDSLHDTIGDLGENETMHVNVNLDVDQDQLEGIRNLLQSVGEDQKITVHIDVDTVVEDLDRMKRFINEDTQKITIPVGFDVDLSDVEEIRIAVNNVSEMSGYARIGVIESALTDSTIRDLRQKLQDFANEEYTATLRVNDDPAMRDIRVFETTVGRQLSDLNIALDVQDLVAHAKVTALEEHLSQLERTWTAVLDVDNKRALDKVRYFLGRLDVVRSQIATATLGADGVPAEVTINNVTNNIRDYGRMRASATLTAEAKQAKAEVAGMTTIIRRYQNRFGGSQGVRTRLTADISQALANIRLLESLLEHVEDDKRRIVLEAEITRAMAELETLREFAATVGAQDPTLQVGIRGAAVAAAEMLGLQALADKLDGTGVDITLDIDDKLSTALPNILGAFELQVQQFQTVATTFTAVTVPMMISSLAAIPAVAAGAAGAVGSLATAIVPGLVGAAASLGTALGLAGTALGIFGFAVRSAGAYTWGLSQNLRQQSFQTKAAKDAMTEAQGVLDGTTKGTQAYANAQKGLTLATINYNNEAQNNKILLESVTPTMIKLARTYAETSNQVTRWRAAMADAVSPFLINFFETLGSVMKATQDPLHDMVSQMGFVASSFLDAYKSGQRLSNIKQIFQGIMAVGPSAMEALTNAIDIFIGVLHVVIPSAVDVAQKIQHMTSAAAGWVNSAKGQEVISQVWQHMTTVAGQLWRIALDLGKGIWGVVAALNASGTGTWLLDQIEKGAHWFAQLMSASGDARQAITDFVNDTKPLLQAAGSLIAAVVKGILHLIDVVRNAEGESGKPFGQIIDVLNALKSLVPDVVDLLVHEFKVIGPLMPGLIKNIGEWAALFQKSTPEMVVFIKTITGLLAAFNSLPEPVRLAIARSLAWAAAIKVLGGGAILGVAGSIAHLAAQFFIYKKIIGALPSSTTKTGGALSKLRPIFDDVALRAMYAWEALKSGAKTAFPIVRNFFTSLPGMARTAASSLAGSMRSIGTALAQLGKGPLIEAGAAGAGAASLFVGIAREIDQFRSRSLPKVEALGPDIRQAIQKGMNTGDWSSLWDPLAEAVGEIGALQSPAGEVTQWLLSPIDRLLKNWGIDITWPWEQRENSIESSIKSIGKIGPFFSSIFKNAIPAVKGAWNGIKNAVVGAARSIWPIIAPVLRTITHGLGAAWHGLVGIARGAWNAVKGAVMGAFRSLWPAIAPAVRAISQGVASAWRGLVGIARTVWNGIKTAIRAVVYTTVGLVLMAWDRVKPRLLAAWNGIKAGAGAAWNAIRGVIASAWNRVKQIFGPALNFIKNSIAAAWAVTKARTTQAWNGIKNFLSGVWNRIKGIFQGGGAISRILGAAWQRVRNITSQVWGAITGFIKNQWQRIKGIVGAAVAVTLNQVRAGWQRVRNITSTVWRAISGAVRQGWNLIKRIAGPAVKQILNVVRSGWQQVKNVTSSLWKQVKNAVQSAWQQIKRIAGPAVKAVLNAVRAGWNQVKQTTSSIWKQVKSLVQNAWNQIKRITAPAVKAVSNAVRSGWNQVRSVTQSVWRVVSNFIRTQWRIISNNVRSAIRVVGSVIRSGWNQARSITQSVWRAITGVVRSVWNQISSTVRNAIRTVVSVLRSGWQQAVAAVRGGINAAINATRGFVKLMTQLGRDAITGLINGIKSGAGAVGSAVGNLLVDAYNRGKQAIQSRSPSRLFERGIGLMIPQGIGGGVARGARGAIDAVRNLMSQLFGAAKGGNPMDQAIGQVRGLRQQQKAMMNMVRMHRMLESSYSRLAKSMVAGARMQQDALRSVEMQMKRNAMVQASMARQQRDMARLNGGGGNGRMMPRRFHATPPRDVRQNARGDGIRTAPMRRDRLDVYVHTDGDGARHVDNQDLADRITVTMRNERRRN